MKITALKKQIKNPERVSIFVDDKYSFSLSLSELVEHKLKNNLELTESQVKKFKKISTDGKLSARALEWVLNRPHSVREFRDYMYRKKADPNLTDKLISQFTKRKYLNDEVYAKWLIEMRGRGGKSNRAIMSELFAKGVDREVANQVLEESADSELARLKILIAKKQRLSRYQKDPAKLMQYLVTQGFNWQLVKQELNNTDPED